MGRKPSERLISLPRQLLYETKLLTEDGMKKWLKPIRAAFKMGLTWAAGWALVGFAIELVHNAWPNPLGSMVDIWPAALAGPAFISGLLFSSLLRMAARRRRFEELSLPGFAVLGGAAGALVPMVPAIMVAVDFASIHGPYTMWQVFGPMLAPCALLGAASAAGSLVLARKAERLELQAGSEFGSEGTLGEAHVEAQLEESLLASDRGMRARRPARGE